MTNYTSTPAFGGPSSHAPQWPPSDTSPSSMFPQNFPFPSDASESQWNSNNMSSFRSGSRLPGLGVDAPGPLPPPPFPFMGPLTPSQFPAPQFPPLQMPFLGYPPIPLPSAPFQTQQNLRPANDEPSHNPAHGAGTLDSWPHNATMSRLGHDQEEGEVTDMEGFNPENAKMSERAGSAYSPPGINSRKDSSTIAEVPAASSLHHAERAQSDGEEGEASSVSRSSSRASGSPYNPPISVNAESQLPSPGMNEEPGPGNFVSKCPPARSSSGRSPVQLRVQAQGALLSLAPHNIRYDELVKEGINPIILRQLYEDVGIKVTTPISGAATSTQKAYDGNQLQSEGVQTLSLTGGVDPAQRQATEQASTEIPVSNKHQQSPVSQPSPSQLDDSRPMERKEVIARMLAAKRAKAPESSPSPQTSVREASDIAAPKAQGLEKATPVASNNAPIKEKEIPVREKNKAQTELARQRIEQLKKQGLMRNQQKTQPDSVPLDQTQPVAQMPSHMGNQYPLPERPAISEAPSSRLPGLFMADSDNTGREFNATPVKGLVLDSTPQPRVAQRKRPRASDFDDLNDMSNRRFSHGPDTKTPEDRLVIDISDDDDDEFYGDNVGHHMDLETPADQGAELSSSTPRDNEPERLRKKDLEIREMHRRIAELEQRQKAKLAASRTQSPRALKSSSVPPPDGPLGTDLDFNNVSPTEGPGIVNGHHGDSTETARETVPATTDIHYSNAPAATSSPRELASMDPTQLDILRTRILRKRTIESGLPGLDAEIQNSEARLSEMKNDEEKLLLNIAKGKRGRQQLVNELENLDLAINGVTLEELEAARHKLDRGQSLSPAEQAPIHPSATNDGNDVPMQDASSTEDKAQFLKAADSQQGPPMDIDPNTGVSATSDDNHSSSDHGREASSSDSSHSAMNESSDSSSSGGSTSDSEESSDELDVSGARRSPGELESATDEQAENDTGPEHDSHTPPPHAAVTIDDPNGTGHHASRTSLGSEGYEPPEPEPVSDYADSEYSPPLSPIAPRPNGPDMVSNSSPNRSQPDEPLTGTVQELGADPMGHVQNATKYHRFSPYKSPLRFFKAYRYHPNYPDTVSGGYRSLTYSHDINPTKYLCPFETAGGVCNDRSCESQHFRDMTLSDDKILVQMGSLREGKTPEEKDQYITGLKEIINEMRRDKVKDFNTVATEIAAYRRRFLQDPSRVLPL